LFPLDINQVPKEKIKLSTTLEPTDISGSADTQVDETAAGGILNFSTASTLIEEAEPLSPTPLQSIAEPLPLLDIPSTSRFSSPNISFCSNVSSASESPSRSSPRVSQMTPKSAMRSALIKAVRPSPTATTRRALEMQRQKRSRIQKRHGEILTKEEAMLRFEQEAKNRDAKKRKKIMKEATQPSNKNNKKKNRFIDPNLCDVCKQPEPPLNEDESDDENENIDWVECNFCPRWFHFKCVDDVSRPCQECYDN